MNCDTYKSYNSKDKFFNKLTHLENDLMKKLYQMFLALSLVTVCPAGEMRIWTSKSGKTVEGEYVNIAFEKVTIKNASNDLVQLPIAQLCDEDVDYIDRLNPPKISIDYMESAQPRQFVADSWFANNGESIDNHPINIIDAKFGALIKQQARNKEFKHDLIIEMYIFSKQCLDPDKYHLIGRVKSEPFRLTKANNFRYEFTAPKTYKIFYYNLWSKYMRGEKPSKYLIIVRNDRGDIISYRARSEWIYENLEKLEKLPVGSWINDKCERVHPTSPLRTRRDGA